MSENEKVQQLETRVREIYSTLYKLYRLGVFEQELKCYQYEWPELENISDFYDYRPPEKDALVTSKTIKYNDAVENLYQLALFLENEMKGWAEERAVLILRIKNLVYEVKECSLKVPVDLGAFFVEQARTFNGRAKKNEVQQLADELRGEPNAPQGPDDARAKVIKALIIAALHGVNQLYWLHMHGNYEEALEIIETIETYIRNEMPRQHINSRKSFGLLGLALALKGRLLLTRADYEAAETAYAQSSDAYIDRLEQKEDFFRKDYISKEKYEEKKIVTLRRAALVSALGVGYLAFISSRITKALAALRISRAALKQNVGAVDGAFTDLLFFACKRAERSSDREMIEDVIQRIEACLDTLSKFVPDSHYVHRAGIELSLALHYRAKGEPKTGEGILHASQDYARAMELLAAAIKHGETAEDGHYKDQSLLTEALFIRSYIRRRVPEASSEKKYSNLSKAEDDAKRSLREAKDNSRMQCEALLALGSVQYEQARYYKENKKEEEFHRKLLAAQRSFRDALARNKKNVRIDAVCYLKLAKLGLLDPGSVALAHDYFKRWKEIESRVEHAFCRDMGNEIGEQLSQDGPLLIIDAEFSLSYPEWKEKLYRHLIKIMLTKLSEQTKHSQYSDKDLYSEIVDALIDKLKFKSSTAYVLIKRDNMLDRLKLMNK